MSHGSNIPELTVSELALSLKRTLEDTYARVRVRGELSKVKIHSSGHLYSDLKDADSVLNIVCWRTQLGKLSISPEEGLDVVCTGRITSYPARSNYQMVVEQMELAGVGALLKLLEDRKKRLAAEGLFDDSRKKAIPFLPAKIGVVTSPTGAVIRDILHRLEDRFPRPVLLWPVRVQGDGAAEEIAAAIAGMNALPDGQRPDVLIVARGGGSLEDLMPFNEEIVVRAAAESQIPLISAVGHETDTTLIDYAADKRAPTPTAAAEFAVPERMPLVAGVEDCGARLTQSLTRILYQMRNTLGHLLARLGTPDRLFEMKIQRLDHAAMALRHGLDRRTQRAAQAVLKVAARLLSPGQRVEAAVQKLEFAVHRLAGQMAQNMTGREVRLSGAVKLLEALSFKSVLNRGFALVRDEEGHPILSVSGVRQTARISIELKDGQIESVVEEVKPIG